MIGARILQTRGDALKIGPTNVTKRAGNNYILFYRET